MQLPPTSPYFNPQRGLPFQNYTPYGAFPRPSTAFPTGQGGFQPITIPATFPFNGDDTVDLRPVTQPLQVGAIAPDFTLPDQNGRPVRLYEALKAGPVVLFFYPKDNSPLCTKQVKAFRDAYPALRQAGASIFGVSSDASEIHQQFIADQRLPFPLLSDPTQRVRKQYGAQGGLISGRATFVIDPLTRRVRASYSSQTNIAEHIRTALTALQQPRYPLPNPAYLK